MSWSWPFACLGLYALSQYHLFEGRGVHLSKCIKWLPYVSGAVLGTRDTEPVLGQNNDKNIHTTEYYAAIMKSKGALCVRAWQDFQDIRLSELKGAEYFVHCATFCVKYEEELVKNFFLCFYLFFKKKDPVFTTMRFIILIMHCNNAIIDVQWKLDLQKIHIFWNLHKSLK